MVWPVKSRKLRNSLAVFLMHKFLSWVRMARFNKFKSMAKSLSFVEVVDKMQSSVRAKRLKMKRRLRRSLSLCHSLSLLFNVCFVKFTIVFPLSNLNYNAQHFLKAHMRKILKLFGLQQRITFKSWRNN